MAKSQAASSSRSAVVVIDDDDANDVRQNGKRRAVDTAKPAEPARSAGEEAWLAEQARRRRPSGKPSSIDKSAMHPLRQPTSVRRSRPVTRQRTPGSDEQENVDVASARETVVLSDSASNATDNNSKRVRKSKASTAAQPAPKRLRKSKENDEPKSTTKSRPVSAKTSSSKAASKAPKARPSGRSSASRRVASSDEDSVQVLPVVAEDPEDVVERSDAGEDHPASITFANGRRRLRNGTMEDDERSVTSVQSRDSDLVEIEQPAAALGAVSEDSEPTPGRLLKADKRTPLKAAKHSSPSKSTFKERLAQNSTPQFSKTFKGKARSSANSSIPLNDDRFGSDAEDDAHESDDQPSPRKVRSPNKKARDTSRPSSAYRKRRKSVAKRVAESSTSANEEQDDGDEPFVVADSRPVSAHESEEDADVRSDNAMDDDTPRRTRAAAARPNERRLERAEQLERLRVQREEAALSRSQFVEPPTGTSPNKSLPIFDPPTTPSSKGRLNIRSGDGKLTNKHFVAALDEDAEDEPSPRRQKKAQQKGDSSARRAESRSRARVNDSDGSLPSIGKSRRGDRSSAAIVLSDADSDDVQIVKKPAKRSSGRPSSIHVSEEDESSHEAQPARRPAGKPSSILDSDDDAPPRRHTSGRRASGRPSSLMDSEEDEQPRQRTIKKSQRPSGRPSSIDDSEDDDRSVKKGKSKRRLERARETSSSSSSSSSSTGNSDNNDHSADEESEDGVENLKLDFDPVKKDKLRPADDKKERRLDAYRTKRAKQQQRKEKLSKGIIESDNEDAETKTTVISDDEEEGDDEDDVDEDYDSDREAVDNFIEEDGKMTEEQRDEREAEMPVEYTRHGKLELDDHVRYFNHYLVHSFYMGKSKRFKKDPMFRNYQYSIAQVRRKIDGVVDSAIASSIWRTEFRAALDERPELDLTVIEYMQGCQGCNRADRTASQRAVLWGKRYDPDTWEEDSESDGDSDGEGNTFELGRFCGRRCSFHHALRHFMYNVAREVRDLCRQPENTPGRLSQDRDAKYEQLTALAVAVCHGLERHDSRLFNRSFVEEKYVRLLDVIEAAKKAYVDKT